MILLYQPGQSVVHRLAAGVKLGALAVLALIVSLAPQTALSIGVSLLLTGGLYLLAGVGLRVLGRELWRMRWVVLVLGAALFVFVGPLTAWLNTGRVVTIVLLASLLTLTTPMDELLGVVRRLLVPLRRVGVDADAVSLTVALTITMIPVVAGYAAQVGEAQRARGVRLGPRGVVPLMVRTLRHADEVGDALAARGLV